MLIVETYLAESYGKGIGLFSKKFIPQGSVYWVRNEKFDKISTKKEIDDYDSLQQGFIKTYGFLEATGNWYLCVDNARFSNHSDNPNTANNINKIGELISCIVIKDIHPGEEILCNYRDICQACIIDLGFENNEEYIFL